MSEPIAIYLHWPWCARICPYCDFNVYKQRQLDGLVPAMLEDLSRQREVTGPREVASVHFGGGTPSLMEAADVAALVGHIRELWDVRDGAEVGLEANPALMDRARIAGFRNAGVNRLSLGVQTFDDAGLAFLGRDHSGEEARDVAELALELIPNTSLDLIFGWAGQGMEVWERDLATALELNPPHISTYQLTIEPGTAFAKSEARGVARGVDAELSADMYECAVQALTGAGFEHYEVSNFAKSGHRSQHNLAYWRGRDYVGVGPGAHGRITTHNGRVATIAPLQPSAYVEDPSPEIESLSGNDVAVEAVLMGLRTGEGVALSRLPKVPDVSGLEGLVMIEDGYLRATPSGRRVLDALTQEMLERLGL